MTTAAPDWPLRQRGKWRPMDMNDGSDPTDDLVSDSTRAAEDDEAAVTGGADRPPTEEEERLADEAARSVDPEVGEHFKEMDEIGADVKGEGQID